MVYFDQRSRRVFSGASIFCIFVVSGWLLSACSSGSGGFGPPPTAASFGGGGTSAGGPTGKDNSGPTTFASPKTEPLKLASGLFDKLKPTKRKVKEADLYRTKGNTLFYLHANRGLTIFDLQDPKNPKPLSNVPVIGYPVEMFVEDKVAYALVRDVATYYQTNKTLSLNKEMESQLISIDISDLKKPVILQRLKLQGFVQEGLSRKAGDVVYLVTVNQKKTWKAWNDSLNFKGQVTLAAVNVKNPKRMITVTYYDLLGASGQVAPLAFRGNKDLFPITVKPKSFHGIRMSVGEDRMIVSENWLVEGKFESTREVTTRITRRASGETTEDKRTERFTFTAELNYTLVNIIDISDPNGRLKRTHRFLVQGAITDQFKQTFISKSSSGPLYLGIFRRNAIRATKTNVTSEVTNIFATVSLNGATPEILGEKAFGKKLETVRASLFDPSRNVAYAITATGSDPGQDHKGESKLDIDRRKTITRIVDPLYAISFDNPKAPRIRSEIDKLSGDIQLFRLIQGGKFLLAVGRDTSKDCTGFGVSQDNTSRVSVSLIDVRSLDKSRLVQRRCIAVDPKILVTTSEVNWNRDQAHKMIGLYESKDANIVSVSVNYLEELKSKTSKEVKGWQMRTAIGLMGWDLSKYDETKKETEQKVLYNLATIHHPKGEVKRTIIRDLTSNTGQKQRVVINLSDHHISTVDVQNLQAPKLLAIQPITSDVQRIFHVGGYALIQSVLDPGELSIEKLKERSDTRFLIKKLDGSNLNQAPVLNRFQVRSLHNAVVWNKMLLTVSTEPGKANSPFICKLVDLSALPAMKIVSTFTLPYTAKGYIWKLGLSGQPDKRTWLSTAQGILFGEQKSEQYILRFLDLQDPKNPQLMTLKSISVPGTVSAQFQFHLLDKGRVALYTKEVQAVGRFHHTVELWSWMKNKWAPEPSAGQKETKVSLPGPLLGAQKIGEKAIFVVGRARAQTNNIAGLEIWEQSQPGAFLRRTTQQQSILFAMSDAYHFAYPKLYISTLTNWFVFDVTRGVLSRQQTLQKQKQYYQAYQPMGQWLPVSVAGRGLMFMKNASLGTARNFHYVENVRWDVKDFARTGNLQRVNRGVGASIVVGSTAYIPLGYEGIRQLDLNSPTVPLLD